MHSLIGPAHPNYQGEKVDDRIIVGLSGYARTGKDEVANVLVSEYGFTRYAFADKLRSCLYALNPIVSTTWNTQEDNKRIWQAKDAIRVQDVIDAYGWNGYKETRFGPEIRALLQRMGTEVGRDLIAEDVWVRGLDDQTGKIVVTDMRFPNEYDRVVNNGGETWRITRPGVEAVNAHISETAIDDKDFTVQIWNGEDLESLQDTVRTMADVRGW